MDRQAEITALVEKVAKKKVEIEPDESLFESGVLDSFALPDLIAALETEFGITVPDGDLRPRNFESVARIGAYLDKHK